MGKVEKTAALFLLGLVVCILWKPALPRKFSISSALRTATKQYTFQRESTSEGGYRPCTANCSWETYTPNSEFQRTVPFREPMTSDDDQKVTAMRQQLACVPFVFGYPQEKSDILFPPYVYPPCSAQSSAVRPTLHLANDTFSMSCPSSFRGKYLLHPDKVPLTDQYKPYELSEYWNAEYYTGKPVEGVKGEFALAGCGEKMNNAEMIPKLRPEAHKRAQRIMEERGKGKKVRPLTVLFLAIDSFSRKHFYRKLNETVEVLNQMNADKKFAVFDFKIHNVMGTSSPTNMVPMFSNHSLKHLEDPGLKDALGPDSLWAIAKDWGFVTFVGFEYCGSNFIGYMGKRLNVDHHVSTFYCAAKAFMDVDSGKESNHQRCIGPHMTHYYLLNYTQEFSRLYKGLNQFMYVHVEAAHEDTGQHAQTLDADLARFLREYTEEFGDSGDMVIAVQGDHGLGYGDWHKDISADQEYKLPALFFIAQTELLERIPNAFDSLWHNTFRLVSKRDFRATVLSLFGEPYGGVFPVHEEKYLSDSYILTREKVRDSRVCNETHIQPWLCSCLEPTEEIPSQMVHSFGLSPLENLIMRVIHEALRLANEKVFTSVQFPVGMLCRQLTFESITRAYGYKINNKIEQIKVEFSINELSTARVETTAIIGTDDQQELFTRSRSWYPLDPYAYIGYPVNIRVLFTQIIDISRKDKYTGPCELVSRAHNVDGEFCICRDLQQLREERPALFDS